MSDMSAWLVVLPAVILIAGTAVGVAFWGMVRLQMTVAIVATAGQFIASSVLLGHVLGNGPLAMSMSNWPAPFGIAFVADTLSATLSAVTGLIGVLVVVFSIVDGRGKHRKAGLYPLMMALLLGVNGAFLTGDVFNLYF